MKKLFTLMLGAWVVLAPAKAADEVNQTAVQNTERAMQLLDVAIDKCFDADGMKMYDKINPFTLSKVGGWADVWPYTAVMESVNSVMEALTMLKEAYPTDATVTKLYDDNFNRYKELFAKLYSCLGYYKGTLNDLVSYTRTATWNVYGVHRASNIGGAAVAGVENVYDDQEWLIRELLRAYKLTGTQSYLTEAEYLTTYVLDGWDCCQDADGNEYGGITWGPGYTSKHACSNGPMVSPLVWLHEYYKSKPTTLLHYMVNPDGTRTTQREKKADYYLAFAKKVYDWHKNTLMDGSSYTYLDGAWATTGDILQETINGKTYRKHIDINNVGGTVFTYNTGTMVSGTADLYRVTGESAYLDDLKKYMRNAYTKFTTNRRIDGVRYREYPYEDAGQSAGNWEGFNVWFADVLLRGFVEGYEFDNVTYGIDVFQTDLDYAYEHHLQNGFLPQDLLGGWGSHTEIRSMFPFTYASEYATLTKHQLMKDVITSGIANFNAETSVKATVDVYDAEGRKVRSGVSRQTSLEGLPSGVYIVGGRKVVVK